MKSKRKYPGKKHSSINTCSYWSEELTTIQRVNLHQISEQCKDNLISISEKKWVKTSDRYAYNCLRFQEYVSSLWVGVALTKEHEMTEGQGDLYIPPKNFVCWELLHKTKHINSSKVSY